MFRTSHASRFLNLQNETAQKDNETQTAQIGTRYGIMAMKVEKWESLFHANPYL